MVKTDYILSFEHLFWVKVRAMSYFENAENQPLFWMKTQRISFQLKNTASVSLILLFVQKNLSIPLRLNAVKVLQNGLGDPRFKVSGNNCNKRIPSSL